MKSETIELDFVNDLMTEARMFRSRHGLSKYSARDMADNAFAHMIAMQVLNREFKYSSIASTYAGRTASYGNFDYFRSNGTDLYAMLHSLFGKGAITQFADEKNSEILLKRMRPNMTQIKGFLNHISTSGANADKEKRMLMQLQSMLFVSDSRLRSMKRLAGDWENLTTREKRTLVSSLYNYFRSNSPKSSLMSALQKLSRERDYVDGEKVKPSKAMAVGAALAGAYIGYKLGRGKGPSYAERRKNLDLRKKK